MGARFPGKGLPAGGPGARPSQAGGSASALLARTV